MVGVCRVVCAQDFPRRAVINAVNDYLYDGADAVYDVLSRTGMYEPEQLRKVGTWLACDLLNNTQGVNAILGFLQDKVDKYFDKFEVRWAIHPPALTAPRSCTASLPFSAYRRQLHCRRTLCAAW